MKLICWLFGHRWEYVNPQSLRGREGVRSFCMRCRLESTVMERCPVCGQKDTGQTGEYPCGVCGLPTLHDAEAAKG